MPSVSRAPRQTRREGLPGRRGAGAGASPPPEPVGPYQVATASRYLGRSAGHGTVGPGPRARAPVLPATREGRSVGPAVTPSD